MKKHQKGFGAVELLLILVIIGVLGLASWYVWIKDRGAPQKSATSQSQTDSQVTDFNSVSITLVNKTSGKPIPHTKVSIYSDNGIRCIQAPCPTNSKSWEGVTGQDGVITVPKSNIQSATYVSPEGYRTASLEYNKATTNYEILFVSQ